MKLSSKNMNSTTVFLTWGVTMVILFFQKMKQREDNYAWEPQSVGNSFVNYLIKILNVVHYSWPLMEFMAFTEALTTDQLMCVWQLIIGEFF